MSHPNYPREYVGRARQFLLPVELVRCFTLLRVSLCSQVHIEDSVSYPSSLLYHCTSHIASAAIASTKSGMNSFFANVVQRARGKSDAKRSRVDVTDERRHEE